MAPTRPPRGSVEYRVVWRRVGWQQPKSKLFQVHDSAVRFARFLKQITGKVRVEGEDPMPDLTVLRIDYRDTGHWRQPKWDGWEGMEPDVTGLEHLHPYHDRRGCSVCPK